MSEISARYRTIAEAFSARVEGIAPEQWSAPTPCSDWTVRDLVAHVIGTQQWAIAALDAAEPAEVDLADDLLKQWSAASGDIREALDDEERASAVVSTMFGEQPFASLVGGLVCSDTLIHTWDLARATGQDERLDPDAVSEVMALLAPMDDSLRTPAGLPRRSLLRRMRTNRRGCSTSVAAPSDAHLSVDQDRGGALNWAELDAGRWCRPQAHRPVAS